MLGHDFCRSDGRLVKLLLSSTLVDNSPLTFIYFTTFEKKRRVRSPLSTQPNFLVFGKIHFTKNRFKNIPIDSKIDNLFLNCDLIWEPKPQVSTLFDDPYSNFTKFLRIFHLQCNGIEIIANSSYHLK